MSPHHLFIGTYTRSGSKGIYALQLDPRTGQLSAPTVAAEAVGPTYLALSPNHEFLYAVSGTEAMAAAFALNATRSHLSPLQAPSLADRQAPSHLAVDHTGRVLLVANYHEGYVASLPILASGIPGAPAKTIRYRGSSVNPERQTSPHPHSITVSPDNAHVIVCDLGLDKIFSYRLDVETATLTPTEPAFIVSSPGSGPRHFAFSPNGRYAFMITEMGATITAYRYDSARGSLEVADVKSTLPSDFRGENKSAAIRVHPNGRFIYGSNRGPDNIAVFAFDELDAKLKPVEIVPTGGQGPRDFALSPDGGWLVAAHQDSNSLTTFQVDSKTGRLTRTPAAAQISMPVCVLFAD